MRPNAQPLFYGDAKKPVIKHARAMGLINLAGLSIEKRTTFVKRHLSSVARGKYLIHLSLVGRPQPLSLSQSSLL